MSGDNWSEEELAASIEAYVIMLRQEQRGADYSKSAVREHFLDGPLAGRSKSSFEKRMGNISHVLDTLGRPWIPGYRPQEHVARNVHAALVEILDRYPDSLWRQQVVRPHRP